MIDHDTLASALADEIAAQRQAALERCGIAVVSRDDWYVLLDGKTMMFRFDDESAAYTFAHELASEMIEAEMI